MYLQEFLKLDHIRGLIEIKQALLMIYYCYFNTDQNWSEEVLKNSYMGGHLINLREAFI